uniref:LRRCT domain-containing protein n=1 Tax=Panagrellus redivivus TaxID=6233 RepID=A0A7E4V7N8_PANRE
MTKLSRITFFSIALLGISAVIGDIKSCEPINEAILNTVKNTDNVPPCHCYHNGNAVNSAWIGCNGQTLPVVFKTLNVLNETDINQLTIWNSLINILPSDMFIKVRPTRISITGSSLGVFRDGVFDKVGTRLKHLVLNNNIIRTIDPLLLKETVNLEVLDLSHNNLVALPNATFYALKRMQRLNLQNNQLTTIPDGVFSQMKELHTLDLSNNKITNITKDSFRGLESLEVLRLSGNTLTNIHPEAFTPLKSLKKLVLSKNRLNKVTIHGLPNLETIFLNNNLFKQISNAVLRDLPALKVLCFDRNQITKITTKDFVNLKKSSHLMSITLAENKIKDIDGNAFEPVQQITSLSLQNNALTSLTSASDHVAYLAPLRNVNSLFLSGNQLTEICDEQLTPLTALSDLSLDRNKITKIEKGAIRGLALKKLFLNDNALYALPDGLFDDLSDQLQVIDLSGNNWQCVCSGWLNVWLNRHQAANLPTSSLGCLDVPCTDEELEEMKSVWWTVLIVGLTTVIAFCAIAAFILVIGEIRRYWRTAPARHVVFSDKERLISESISFPNPMNLSPPPAASKSILKNPLPKPPAER